MVQIYIGHVKYPLFLLDFSGMWIFSTDFLKNTQILNFMKICPVGAKPFHAGRRIDRHNEGDRHFSQFC
jgi:hypothetical protein